MWGFNASFRLRGAVRRSFAAVALAAVFAASPTAADPSTPPRLPVWNNGAQCQGRADVEYVWIDANTAVLRESICVTREAPFLYLLFGDQDALLIDSGDGAPGLPATVRHLVEEHTARAGRAPRRLIVAHTHAHADHTRGDAALRRGGAIVIGLSPTDVARFFGIGRGANREGAIDLGARRVAVLAIPGHELSHVAFHDGRTGFLFTGDTLYPGRLYVPRREFRTYQASVRRLQAFAAARGVTTVLGAHVEMSTTPGVDYPFDQVHRPNEHPLPLARAELNELVAVVDAVARAPQLVRRDHFILTPIP